MQNQLKRAMELAKKTGDRLIVFDNVKSDAPYVVLALDEYERLMVKKSGVRGLTEDELLDKINRDIAIWKSDQVFFNEYLDKDYENGCGEEIADEDEIESLHEELEDELEEEFYFEPEEYKQFSPKMGVQFEQAEFKAEERPGRHDALRDESDLIKAVADKKYYYGPFTEEEVRDDVSLAEAMENKPRRWSIPTDRKKAADEVVEEGKNYLEEIDELPY
ncbi:MAG: hypothetical protein WCW77_03010 [Patescibacteria group bacterium]|jgi:hypothetical protein